MKRETFPERLARVGFYFALLLCVLMAIPTSGGGVGHRDFGTGLGPILLFIPIIYIVAYSFLRGTWRRK